MAVYKVSYVIRGRLEGGAILRQKKPPKVGEKVNFRGRKYEVAEVINLMPPIDNVVFLHATLKPLDEVDKEKEKMAMPGG